MAGLRIHGKDWNKLVNYTPGRTVSALKTQAHLLKLELMQAVNTKNKDVLRILRSPKSCLRNCIKRQCQHKHWAADEDARLVKALQEHGKDWKLIVNMFQSTKSKQQIMDRVQRFRKQLPQSVLPSDARLFRIIKTPIAPKQKRDNDSLTKHIPINSGRWSEAES